MALKTCPDCGEKYSDTYRKCPFCEEEKALRKGEKLYKSRGGHRVVTKNRQYSVVTPMLVVLILLMAGLLVYLLYGNQLKEKFGKDTPPDKPAAEDVTPVEPMPIQPEEPEPGTMPETDTPAPAVQEDYDQIMALPSGLKLSTTDFTLKSVGEQATLRVSGGSGSYTWVSEDEGVASVDENGKVTAISKGTINVVVSDGSKKGVCIVRCSIYGSAGTVPSTPTTPSDSGTLRTGEAMVINGGNGVRVRSGPGTDYDILASVSNGTSVRIVESAGNNWYKITFYGLGGSAQTGYMRGDFLKNT